MDSQELVKQHEKQHRERNNDNITARKQQYYQANNEDIQQRREETTTCPCGSTYAKCRRVRHEKTNKHQLYSQSPNQSEE